MLDILLILGLETDTIQNHTGKWFGIMFYHFFMLSITGGLWALWLTFKYVRHMRRKNNWMR